ncbi:autotransporter-associated beta strand protein [Paenochrobactrum gallinarii]|uniref:Autotransporter-associated beta strand protein n=1 Tax=Paenochrobactrum gallinarii TaxID=643673 RepID=A0A841M0T2_9HYPH|nr:autotransporter-associated beta strand repeat-containing protein [Paenochrobactrum gallinarii]MBB6262630.1 autotransporter-associated beta strand protein [Paenochrobactrum gallinarii]
MFKIKNIYKMQFKIISCAASPLALMRIIKPSVNAALWAVTSVSVLGFSQSANVWAANIESRGGNGGESSNGTNGMDGAPGTNGIGGVGGDGGAGTGTPAGAGIGGSGGALGASTVDQSSIVTITGGDGLAGTNGTLSENKNAGGGGGGGAGGAGVISTEVIFESQTMINGGSGGSGGNGASANMSSEKSGSSAGGGGDGGIGIYYGNATTATNSGTVRGGNGGGGGNGSDGQNIKASASLISHDGGSSGNGGKGGTAALFNDGVTINNTTSGLIHGGMGGAAGNAGHGGNSEGSLTGSPSIGGTGGEGGKGEDGGYGIRVFGGGTLTNEGTINGGSGGQGGKGGQGGYDFKSAGSGGAGGDGGNGGSAVIFSGTAILTNKGFLSGGDGSIGGEGGGSGTTQGTIGNLKSGDGGNGGNGGIAVQLSGTDNIVTNSGGSITGGDGKNGGKGGDPFFNNRYSNHGKFSYSGSGGNGADALQLGNASKVNNESGAIQGGAGGAGGDQSSINISAPSPRSGGVGGNGITANQGSIITNAGTIAGGAGGAGGLQPSGDYGEDGLGGYGILLSGADGKVINSGIISGGLSGNSQLQASAISFTGGNSTLELHAGSIINGDVVAQKSGNTFILGGDDNATFSDSISVEITGTPQYRGFQTNIKDGASHWSLTGYSQSWTIKKGVLQIGDGGTAGSVTGNVITGTDATTKGTLAFNLASDVVFSGVISGTGSVEKHSADIITLTSDNNYTGGTVILSGTLRLGNSGTTGSIIGNVVNSGILSFNRQDSLTFDGIISGSGSVSQIGTGTTVLVSDNTYTGATNVVEGNLQIGDGHITGNISGNAFIDKNATFAFNRSDALNFNGVVSGTGLLQQIGTGALSLNGDSSAFTGRTLVSSGTILVHGALGGTVDVALNGSLGGNGTIKGEAILDPGGASLVGRQGQVLTFEKDLSLAAGNNINVTLGAPSTNGLFYIQGNLTLNGQLNITDKGGFGPGLYRVFDYDGALTDDGFVIGSVPAGNSASMTIQTSVAKQVNLVNSAGASLNFWNGADTSKHGNGTINGGDGVWNNVDPNWTDADGIASGSWKDDDFAIFAGFSGIVSLSDSTGTVTVSGMQFSTDGYHLQGDALILADTNTPIIRVDNNTTAIIEVELQGTKGLNKTDFGTLVLTGDSHYTGGTTVSEGILKLGNGGTAGSIAGDVSLKRTAYDYGTLAFNRSDIVTFTGTISGEGEVLHQGVGTTIFTGDNSYSGGLRVEKGTVQAGIIKHAFGRGRLMVNSGATADLKDFDTTVSGLLDGKDGGGAIALGAGSLTLNQDFNSTFSGIISGAGGLKKNNSGSLTLSGVNNYDGATELNDGILKQGIQSAFSSTSAYTIGIAGTLMLNGFNTHMLSLSNNGVTDFGGTGGAILSILGNYTGSGLLLLNTVLGDDLSPANSSRFW